MTLIIKNGKIITAVSVDAQEFGSCMQVNIRKHGGMNYDTE